MNTIITMWPVIFIIMAALIFLLLKKRSKKEIIYEYKYCQQVRNGSPDRIVGIEQKVILRKNRIILKGYINVEYGIIRCEIVDDCQVFHSKDHYRNKCMIVLNDAEKGLVIVSTGLVLRFTNTRAKEKS